MGIAYRVLEDSILIGDLAYMDLDKKQQVLMYDIKSKTCSLHS